MGTYDGSGSHEENYEERCGLASSTDLRHWSSLTAAEPWLLGPCPAGSVRCVDLQRIDGRGGPSAEVSRPDGAHELLVIRADRDPGLTRAP